MWLTGRHPRIESVDLTAEGRGSRLTISGEQFGTARGRSRIILAGQPLPSSEYLAWDEEEVIVRIPAEASSGLVYLERGSRLSNGVMVTLRKDLPTLALTERRGVGPLIGEIEPVRGQIGEVITLRGRHFGRDKGESSVQFSWAGPVPSRTITPQQWEYLSWSDREIVVRVPDGATAGPVYVQTAQGRSRGVEFEVPFPLGGIEYRDPESFAVLVSVEVDRISLPDTAPTDATPTDTPAGPPELYLWLSNPVETPAQGPVQLVSQTREPLFDDVDGLAVYRTILDNTTPRVLNRLFLVERYRIETDVERLTVGLDMPEELLERYGRADSRAPSDSPEIGDIVRRLVAPGAHPYEIGRRLFEYVAGTYEAVDIERTADVLQLIESRRGNSQALSTLFVALARRAGLPARLQSGILVLPGGAVRHCWADFYVPAVGWIPVDAALELGLHHERIPEEERLESYLGAVDANRVVFSAGIARPRPMHPDGLRSRVGEHYSLQQFYEEIVGDVDSHRTRWYDIQIVGEYPGTTSD